MVKYVTTASHIDQLIVKTISLITYGATNNFVNRFSIIKAIEHGYIQYLDIGSLAVLYQYCNSID